MSKMTKSPIDFARTALKIAAKQFPKYSHSCSPHKFTQAQLFAVLALKDFMKLDYRGIIESA